MSVTHPPTHRKNGLASQAATVALGPARSATSHLRRVYERRYRGRHRYPALVFLIDVVLFLLAATLVVTALWYARLPVPTPGVAVAFASAPIVSGAPAPFQAVVRSTDGNVHSNVRLWWRLPAGAQVLEAYPPLSADGTAFLGTVEPGREVTSKIVARVFLPPGANADIVLSVFYEDENGEKQFIGTERRPIVGTALTADIPDELRTVVVTPEGATLPLKIENHTNEALPSVHVTLRRSELDSGEQIPLGDVGPHESRWMYLPVRSTQDPLLEVGSKASLQWSVGATARDLASGSWEASVVASTTLPIIAEPLVTRPGAPTNITITNGSPKTQLVVVHPLLDPAFRTSNMHEGSSVVTLPPPVQAGNSNHEWLAMSLVTREDGSRLLGPAKSGVSVIAFPFATQIRYRSSSGDQLGVGPHPPQVDQETRYWVFWTVGPIDNRLRNISVETSLPPGVTATRNVSSPDGGDYSIIGGRVVWTLPRLGAEDSGAQVTQATFGFEIAVNPQSSQAGTLLNLTGVSRAQAIDPQSGLVFEAVDSMKTSHLPEDPAGDPTAGIVLPSAIQANTP